MLGITHKSKLIMGPGLNASPHKKEPWYFSVGTESAKNQPSINQELVHWLRRTYECTKGIRIFFFSSGKIVMERWKNALGCWQLRGQNTWKNIEGENYRGKGKTLE